MLNLDTHILLRALKGDITPAERRILSRDTWSISSIVLWEIAKLAQLGRIDIDLDDPELNRTLARLYQWPISLDVCKAIVRLDFRGDPADELIASTSLVHNVPLLTRDTHIRRSKLVPLAR
jgi:PIN domain nuclease of toxin-antitoxin system